MVIGILRRHDFMCAYVELIGCLFLFPWYKVNSLDNQSLMDFPNADICIADFNGFAIPSWKLKMPTTVYVKCSFCEKEVKQRKLDSHRLNCKKRKAVCQFCLELFSIEDIENHEQQCSVKVAKNESRTSSLKETVDQSDTEKGTRVVPCDNFSKEVEKSDMRDKCMQREVQYIFCDEKVLETEHYDFCEFMPIRCVNDCGKKLPRKDLYKHIENECPQTLIECKYCKEEVKKQLLVDHHSECLKFPIPCPKICGVEVTREDMESHLDEECLKRFTACAYMEMQCRSELAKIINDKLFCRVEIIERKLEYERKRNEELQMEIKEIRRVSFMWKVEGIAQEIEEAKKSEDFAIESAPFYSSKHGYKLKAILYPDSHLAENKGHLGVFILIMPGESFI